MKRESNKTKRLAIVSMAFCLCSSIAWDSSQTRNDNSVTSLNYSQESARTLIEIGVQSDPTFSVYTLKNPERVVVEILDCDSSTRLSPIQVRNGIIDTAAVSVSQSNDYSTCRVILGLEKEASYAVDSTSNRITVSVDGKPEMNPSEMATAYETMKQSREEALANARSIVERERAEAENARAEAEAARNELANARNEVQTARTELANARNEAQTVRSELSNARNEIEMARVEAQNALNELAKARSEAQTARATADASVQREKAALAQLEKAYADAQNRVSAIEAQRNAAQEQYEQSQMKNSELESVQAELLKAQANAAALERARNQAIERAQAAESQRDLAQAQARESLQREQNAIEKLQQEQRIAAEKTAQIARMNSQIEQSQAEKSALLADLQNKTSQAQLLSERAKRAQIEAQQLVNETRQNEEARVADAESRLAAAEKRYEQAQQKAMDAQTQLASNQAGSQKALESSNEELLVAKNALALTQKERDDAVTRARQAETQAQNALITAQNQKHAAETQLSELNRQLSEANAKLATLEQERTNAIAQANGYAQNNADLAAQNARYDQQLSEANARLQALEHERTNAIAQANGYAQNNANLAAQNAELLKRLSQQEAEMAKLNQEVLAGGAAREKIKKLEAELKDEAVKSAEYAELKEQARQGRHAREQLHKLQEENDQLRTQLEQSQTVMAATTAGKADNPSFGQIAGSVPPIDMTIGQAPTNTKVATTVPFDDRAAAQASVRDIQFRRNANGDGMQVVVKLSAPVDKVENIDLGSQKSALRIAGVVLPDDFNKKYDTSAFNQGVRFVDSTQASGGLELIAQASSKTIDSIEQNGDTITWNIQPLRDGSGAFKAPVDRRRNAMLTAAEPNPALSTGNSYAASTNLRDTPLAKRKITLDIHDADINDLLRLLSDEINTSIVVSPEVKGNITLSLKSVPLDQALDIIMRMHDLGMRYEGNVIWIAKADTFRAEEERAIKAAEVRERLEPLEVRLLPVNYALAKDLSGNVQSLLSSRGSVNIDDRTNTLILKDVAANLDAAEILVSNLDTQTPQILIEARIVETQANFSKEIGIQWGGDGVASAATGNATGIVFPSTIGIAGGSTSDNNSGTSATPNFAVNLPASVGTGSGGALGITLGSLGGAINLNIRLSAMEEKGFLKIVSAPRIMTLDNIQASIESGTSIPISVVSAAGAQTQFYDAKLNLQVTPHVTRDGNVYLKINISKNEPDFGNTGANGDPSIIRKEAQTELLVPDGETTVIGGIYSRNTSQNMSSVPFFGSIPILGYLFRSTSETDNRTELLIFITPRIINRDASISASGAGSFIPPVERESNSK